MRELKKFLSTIPRSKAKVLSSLMAERQAEGQFVNVDEYKAALSSFVDRVSSSDPTSFYRTYRSEFNSRINSLRHNQMLSLCKGDLDLLFTEADNILDMIEAHENVFQKQAVHDLKYTMERLQEQVDLYEFLVGSTDGFTKSYYNTFSSGKNAYPYDSEFGPELYVDYRTGRNIVHEMAYDPIGKSLVLPAKLDVSETFVSVNVKDGIIDSHGQVAFPVLDEPLIACRVNGSLWVAKTLNSPISRDSELHMTFSSIAAKASFTTKLDNALPANPGEYTIVYDADMVAVLKAAGVENPLVGEIYLWNESPAIAATADAVIVKTAVDVVVDAVLEAPGQAVFVADALLEDGTVLADAIIAANPNPCWRIGTISYSYLVDARDYHKSDLEGDPVTSDINHILDKTQETYWFNLILKDRKVPGGVRSSLKLNFAGPRQVNYVDIDPVSKYPFYVDQISYITREGNKVKIIDSHPSRIMDETRFFFEPVTAKSIVLDIRQDNYEIHTYNLNLADDLMQLLNEQRRGIDPQIYQDAMKGILSNTKLAELLGVTIERSEQFRTVYEYIYGIDNISAGMFKPQPKGVFVSKPTEKAKVSLIGFNANESIPPGKKISFEYELTKKDYAIGGALVGSDRFPVLNKGATQLTHERLIVQERTHTASTRFRAHGTTLDDADINKRATFCNLKVYQNGAEIARGVRWDIGNDNDNDQFTKITLDIDRDNQEEATAIYTASYQPLYALVGDKRELWIDPARTMRRRADGLIECKKLRGNVELEYSRVYMTCTQRVNEPNSEGLVGQLLDYRVSIGEHRDDRFSAI